MKKFKNSLFGALFILGNVLIVSCDQIEDPIAANEEIKPSLNSSSVNTESNSVVLFEDDFNDGNYDGWTAEVGSWSVENGELHGVGAFTNDGVDGWIRAGNTNWTDYSLEAKVIFKTGNAELIFRSTGEHWQNAYRFIIWWENSPGYPNMFSLSRYKNGEAWATVFTKDLPGALDGNAPSPVRITNPAYPKVEVIGNTIRLFINGQLIYELEDPDPLTNGDIGLSLVWNWQGNFDDVVVKSLSEVIPVDIDIKPGSYPNSINCKNDNGIIAVAILTTTDFDATTVDHTTVRFGRKGTEAIETHKNKKTGELKRHEEDVDSDGDIDLVFHFRVGDTKIKFGDKKAILTGKTFDSQKIKGKDSIRTVGK